MASPKKVYWDTNVWLALINQEAGRVDRCRYVISEARAGKVQIWTSTISLAEVFKVTGEISGVVLPEIKDLEFEQYVTQDCYVLVQVDYDIGVQARRLLRAHPPLKKPADAIHLATALESNVEELHTFDDKNLIPLSGLVMRADGAPLTICFPPESPQPSLIKYDDPPPNPNAGVW